MIITLDKAQIMWIEFLDQKNVLQISKFSQKMHIVGAGGLSKSWLYLNSKFIYVNLFNSCLSTIISQSFKNQY